jgi:parallel beta-helix repeat protein
MKKPVLIILCLLITIPAYARTITINTDGTGDYPTIQTAIDDANDGDIILVADGTYSGEGNRNISFKGKAITVRSENGPENCIIDCNSEKYSGFVFDSGEDANSILDGFTIINAHPGIQCRKSSPTIKNCIITNNSYSGIKCREYSSPTITNCKILNNTASDGGGICIDSGSEPIIQSCIISGNSAESGSGIYCIWGSILTITDSVEYVLSSAIGLKALRFVTAL